MELKRDRINIQWEETLESSGDLLNQSWKEDVPSQKNKWKFKIIYLFI